jgi:hypothetical protein
MDAGKRRKSGAKKDQLEKTVILLLHEAREGLDERRREKRHPFFAPIQIAFTQDAMRQRSCFSRDISATGVSLLHYMPLKAGEVVLTIPSKLCGTVRIRSEIIWSEPCGEGWHISGARFIAILA